MGGQQANSDLSSLSLLAGQKQDSINGIKSNTLFKYRFLATFRVN